MLRSASSRQGWQTDLPGTGARAVPGPLPHVASQIFALVSIAAAHESSLPLEELVHLLPQAAFPSEGALESYVRGDRELRERITVLQGELVPRGREQLVQGHEEQKTLAARRLAGASAFTENLLRVCPWLRLVAISGSVAYGRTRPDDDIDFFLVVARGRLWVTLLVAMVLARIARGKVRGLPTYCFNRALEEDRAMEAFSSRHEALFAREALNLRVLRGRSFYGSLIERAPWMEQHFPVLYRSRRAEASGPEATAARGEIWWSLANAAAFLGLGAYLRLVGQVRNRRHVRSGEDSAQFRTVVQRGFCAYESNKYEQLRQQYREAF